MDTWPPQPTRLHDATVLLEPLAPMHVGDLQAAVRDGQVWQAPYGFVPTLEDMPAFVAQALAEQRRGRGLPFVVRVASSGQVVGTTRYRNIESSRRRLEIGYTWYAQSVQRTSLNTVCKYLLLEHAFDRLHSMAVEWRVHALNLRSRAAVEKLGARQDGVLRNLLVMPDGGFADVAVYSVIASEWPTVRDHLQARARRLPSPARAAP